MSNDQLADERRELVQKRMYHIEKSRELREGWSALGVKQVSAYVPEYMIPYFRGTMNVVTAVELMKQVYGGDVTAIETLAGRTPKYTVSMEDIDGMLLRAEQDEEHAGACKKMLDAMRAARMSKLEGERIDLPYEMRAAHLAREYVLCIYVRGMYELAGDRLKRGSELPNQDINLGELRVNVL
jgi:hypothetical protein